MKFILDSVNSQGLPSYEDVTGGMVGETGDETSRKASVGANTSKIKGKDKINQVMFINYS